jgi:hypothetical protein
MKYPIPILFSAIYALVLSFSASAQTNQPAPAKTNQPASAPTDQPSLSALRPVTIRFRNPRGAQAPDHPTLFSHFEVIDERPDTGRIGVHTNTTGLGRPHDRQLVFERPAAMEIADYLNAKFTRPGSPYTALVVLRTLWLSDANFIREDMIRDPDRRFERTHIRLKAEIYAIRDHHYMPVLRLDTLQASIRTSYYSTLTPYSDWDGNISSIFDQLADTCSLVTAEKTDRGRWIEWEDIRQFNASRFDAPISHNTALTRGVYANFEEFRNNTPSIKDFEIKMENRERLLYLHEDGKTVYSHSAWGYCDGTAIYIMRDGILCPAWKEGKAFYFYSDTRKPRNNYKNSPVLPPNGTPVEPYAGTITPSMAAGGMLGTAFIGTMVPARSDYKQRCIYSIDMDTGDIY